MANRTTIFALGSLFVAALAGSAGCAAPVGSDPPAAAASDDEALTSHAPYPVCISDYAGEAWVWSNTGETILDGACANEVVSCAKLGTANEGWWAGETRLAYVACGTAETTRLAAASKGLEYPSESDYPLDVLLIPGVTSGSVTEAKLRAALALDDATPVEATTVSEALAARRFEGYPPEVGAGFAALKRKLVGYKAYRVGTIQVQIYFVKILAGSLVGLHTVSIET